MCALRYLCYRSSFPSSLLVAPVSGLSPGLDQCCVIYDTGLCLRNALGYVLDFKLSARAESRESLVGVPFSVVNGLPGLILDLGLWNLPAAL